MLQGLQMAIPYPSLDSGYIYDPQRKLSCLMSDFLEAEFSQSYLFMGSISSLPSILQLNDGDSDATANAIRLQLDALLSKYFDNSTVECGVQATRSATSYDLLLAVTARQDEAVINLKNVLNIEGTKLKVSLDIRK